MKAKPRGIRNHNPGNIELGGDRWQGLAPKAQQTDGRFAVFNTPAYGIRALCRILITYQDDHKLNTVRKVINRWAPSSENNTDSYVSAVCNAVDVGPDEPLDLQEYHTLRPFAEAIIRHENGAGPLKTPSTWYDDPTMREALRLAGVKAEKAELAAVPVTKETIGATATGLVGVSQIADVAPQISEALTSANDNLSSGSIIRIALGVATIALAIFIAYSQVKKHQQGVL